MATPLPVISLSEVSSKQCNRHNTHCTGTSKYPGTSGDKPCPGTCAPMTANMQMSVGSSGGGGGAGGVHMNTHTHMQTEQRKLPFRHRRFVIHFTCVCMDVCMRVYTCVYVCISIYVWDTCVFICVLGYVCMLVCVYVCVCVYVYVCVCTCRVHESV